MRRGLWLLALLAALWASAARAQSGPAWWRISDGGGSVLWVLGIPDGMMMDMKWSDASLQHRLSAARGLVSPLLGRPMIEPPTRLRVLCDGPRPLLPRVTLPFPWTYELLTQPGKGVPAQGCGEPPPLPNGWIWARTLGRNSTNRTFEDPLSDRLPPATMARVEKALRLGAPRTDILHAKTWEVALWLDLWNWPRGEIGNPVVNRAQELARQKKVAVDQLFVPAIWRPMLIDSHGVPKGSEAMADFDAIYSIRSNMRFEPPEAVQQKCLEQVLDQTESGQMPAIRTAAMEAWARGDVPNALKRSNIVQLCLLGNQPSTGAGDFEREIAYLYIQSLDRAFDQAGQTVALVEFDPLLLESGGVLDHYRHLGYDIVQTDGMGD